MALQKNNIKMAKYLSHLLYIETISKFSTVNNLINIGNVKKLTRYNNNSSIAYKTPFF